MQIEKAEFGSITIDDKASDHDVIIHLSGEAVGAAFRAE